MSLTILAGVAGALVAVAAAALLWRESGRREPSARNAYRALAAAALLWGAGFVDAESMGTSGTGTSLTSADLLSLLAPIPSASTKPAPHSSAAAASAR